ncbi:GtrA family protein [Candidatus Wolfebacteria bacterium]|nr:GtrA family protein [Candidatus Wolfebacteria bacterium]
MINKKDYLLISIIGFFTGLFFLPVLNNINFSFLKINLGIGLLIILIITIFADLALFIFSLIARKIPIFLQLAKFAAVGALNTFLDLGVLNGLILLSGIAAGLWFSVFKAISFILANINSYFWNKHWTFGSSQKANIKEFGQFLIVSLIGLGINIGIASFIVNIIGPFKNFSPELWANIGALFATIASLFWNFIGYKLIVFKK